MILFFSASFSSSVLLFCTALEKTILYLKQEAENGVVYAKHITKQRWLSQKQYEKHQSGISRRIRAS